MSSIEVKDLKWPNTLLCIENLTVDFTTQQDIMKVLDGVSVDVKKGEILAIVGESGSGKSTLCKTILGILPKNAYIKSGSIEFEGVDMIDKAESNSIGKISKKDKYSKLIKKIRSVDISMVFQNPASYLDPTLTIGKQIVECIIAVKRLPKREAKIRALELIDVVGIDNPKKRFEQYPYQLSGGMLQRILLAIAISNNPKLLIADEPTTSLDTIVQKQIVTLMKNIQRKYNTSIIFVTHDLILAKSISDRIAVMHDGEILEVGNTLEIFNKPINSYTKNLINSLKSVDIKGGNES